MKRFWKDVSVEPEEGGWGIRLDGRPVKTVGQAPAYPMQMMVAVFDFPDKAASAPAGHVPVLGVDWIRGGPGAP